MQISTHSGFVASDDAGSCLVFKGRPLTTTSAFRGGCRHAAQAAAAPHETRAPTQASAIHKAGVLSEPPPFSPPGLDVVVAAGLAAGVGRAAAANLTVVPVPVAVVARVSAGAPPPPLGLAAGVGATAAVAVGAPVPVAVVASNVPAGLSPPPLGLAAGGGGTSVGGAFGRGVVAGGDASPSVVFAMAVALEVVVVVVLRARQQSGTWVSRQRAGGGKKVEGEPGKRG